MNKTKYNQLREEIIKAVPEIEKLCNGCEVIASLCENDVPIDDYEMDTFIIGKKDTFKKCKANGLTYIIHNQREYELYKIIGRDITLEDCMIAGFKSLTKMNLGNLKNAEIYEKYKKFVIDITLQESQWKPNIPLQDQSDGCISLLHELIYNK